MKKYLFVILLPATLQPCISNAQDTWHLQKPDGKTSFGVDMYTAAGLLGDRRPANVIVAVIDNGCDINHLALKPYVWTNPGEQPGNHLDDDSNGYVDDVNGWNFLGGEDADIAFEAFEDVRHYQKLKRLYADTAALTDEQKEELGIAKRAHNRWKSYAESMAKVTATLYKRKDNVFLKGLLRLVGEDMTDEELKKMNDEAKALVAANLQDADSARRAIVGDEPGNPEQQGYGNNRLAVADPAHGTHTAGIVLSVAKTTRDSGAWLKILPLRAVPVNGDERDKDVANAIRYAVDNGAKVINMSFGKGLSPDSAAVRRAIRYAMEHDVLLVHGAGNDGRHLDSANSGNYPNPILDSATKAPNWIEVGAIANKRKKLIAPYSNYGMKSVDILAPGSNVYSTVPGDKYDKFSGTSMASPVVAGVAAVIRSYFPSLTAAEVKQLLMDHVYITDGYYPVPGENKVVAQLWYFCKAGGIVNAARAIEVAKQHEAEKR